MIMIADCFGHREEFSGYGSRNDNYADSNKPYPAITPKSKVKVTTRPYQDIMKDLA